MTTTLGKVIFAIKHERENLESLKMELSRFSENIKEDDEAAAEN